MVELEYHNDKMNEHDVWESVRRKELTVDEVQEFKEEFESMIENLKVELSSLEGNFDDNMRELNEALGKCEECEEPIDTTDSLCNSCLDDQE